MISRTLLPEYVTVSEDFCRPRGNYDKLKTVAFTDLFLASHTALTDRKVESFQMV